MAPLTSPQPGPRTQTNGVLQVTASQTAGNASKSSSSKVVGPRLKVVVRRLPPGLTETEFTTLLGNDWATGQGKVDWFSYKPGKDSKDPSKPSRPSRAYLHINNDIHLASLSELIRRTIFEDAQNTWNSPCLVGPPTVEFAPYGRIPSGRRRPDARQGTIDQDPEFMDFLESLANPGSSKETTGDSVVEGAEKGEKVTTTPLVQYLKDKKANKLKEAAVTKAAKQARIDTSASKSPAKSKDSSSLNEDSKKSAKDVKKEKLVEKAAREAVKVLNREAAGKVAGSSATETPKNPRAQPRERGSIAAAARILQRDLGLTPGNAHRKAKADAEKATKAESSTSGTPSTLKGTQAKGHAGRGSPSTENDKPAKETPTSSPVVLLKKPTESRTSTPAPTPPTAPAIMAKSTPALARKQPVAVPSAGATKAFVKHANPSQGVTEALLKEAMETFGAVSHVEIDKRKGFAYVDFVEPEGLVKAMAANPTKIAQGTVQVLEKKEARPTREPPSGPSRGGMFPRGGRGGGRGQRGGRGGSASNTPTTAPTGPAAGK